MWGEGSRPAGVNFGTSYGVMQLLPCRPRSSAKSQVCAASNCGGSYSTSADSQSVGIAAGVPGNFSSSPVPGSRAFSELSELKDVLHAQVCIYLLYCVAVQERGVICFLEGGACKRECAMAHMRSCYPVASLRCCCADSRSMSTWLCEQEARTPRRLSHATTHARSSHQLPIADRAAENECSSRPALQR